MFATRFHPRNCRRSLWHTTEERTACLISVDVTGANCPILLAGTEIVASGSSDASGAQTPSKPPTFSDNEAILNALRGITSASEYVEQAVEASAVGAMRVR